MIKLTEITPEQLQKAADEFAAACSISLSVEYLKIFGEGYGETISEVVRELTRHGFTSGFRVALNIQKDIELMGDK